jgi:hypothetical protein
MVAVLMIGVLALIGFLCVSGGIASLDLKSSERRRDQGSTERATGK